jgi:integrase
VLYLRETNTKISELWHSFGELYLNPEDVAVLSDKISCHSFRASGITAYLENGGSLEHAQTIAAHESPRTTKLYDRRSEKLAAEEIERIKI